jgi:hypothetical protein
VLSRAAAAIALVVASSLPARAAAPERPIEEALELQYDGACLDPTDLAQRLAEWLGRERIESDWKVVVRGRDSPAAKLQFEVRQGGRRRALRTFQDLPERCDDVRAALAFAIALAIDARVIERKGRPEVATTEPKPAPPASQPEVTSTPPGPQRVQSPVTAIGEPRGLLLWRVLPDAVLGGETVVGVRWRSLSVAAGVAATLYSETTLGAGQAAVRLLAARLELCVPFSETALRVESCIGGYAGSVTGRGKGFVQPVENQQPYVAATTGFALAYAMTDWASLRGAVNAVHGLRRPVLVVQRGDSVVDEQALPALGASASLGLVLNWPN